MRKMLFLSILFAALSMTAHECEFYDLKKGLKDMSQHLSFCKKINRDKYAVSFKEMPKIK